MCTDSDHATIIRRKPELDRVVLWYLYRTCVVQHKEISTTLTELLLWCIPCGIDEVECALTAHRVLII
jgi:hypothetical protein